MSWELALLIASGLLNVILIFKPAVNDITAKWFGRRWERKDEQQKMLMELNQRVGALPNDYMLALLSRIPVPKDDPASEQERDAYQKQRDAFAAKLKETQEFLAGHELQFRPDIRARVTEFRTAMMMPLGSLNDPRAIFAKSDALTRIAEAIRAEVARHVGSGR